MTRSKAISELDPGQITGPLSSIFRDVIDALAENFGYDPSNLAAAPVCFPSLPFPFLSPLGEGSEEGGRKV